MAQKLSLVKAVKYTTGSSFPSGRGKGTAKRKQLADFMRKMPNHQRRNRVRVAMREGTFNHVGRGVRF